MNKKFVSYFLLGLIIVTASLTRFYQLDHSDVINDEAIIGFRSIGYIDFFSSPYQTTPWEWFSDVPSWSRLSFHDHPPLTFIIQHLFFLVFGVSVITLRLPFVLAGIGSVWLLYFIGQRLFDKKTGFIAASLLAVNSYHVWVSRTGLQESLVIFFILLTFLFFLQSLENNRHWLWGLSLGLAFLTKYTSFILLPIIFIYLLFFKKSVLFDKRFWVGVALTVLLFSPVLIYNFKMYQAVGHFDLQFSYLFGQQVDEWQSLPGKEQAGNFTDRVKNLVPAIYNGFLWPIFSLIFLALSLFGYNFFKHQNDFKDKEKIWLIVISLACCLLFFLLIGPSKRFVTLIIPFIVLLVAWVLAKMPRLVKIILLLIIIPLEIFFSYNTLLAYNPVGIKGITYSYLDIENYNWGYNQLDNYLENILKGKKPAFSLVTRYQFLEEIKKKSLVQAKNKQDFSVLLVYDSNFYDLATLWTFHRRLIYQGWPAISADDYLKEGNDFWKSQGVKEVYFFKIRDPLILSQSAQLYSSAAETLVDNFNGEVEAEIIKRSDGREVFEVYHQTF